jgi:hypothetical protein
MRYYLKNILTHENSNEVRLNPMNIELSHIKTKMILATYLLSNVNNNKHEKTLVCEIEIIFRVSLSKFFTMCLSQAM